MHLPNICVTAILSAPALAWSPQTDAFSRHPSIDKRHEAHGTIGRYSSDNTKCESDKINEQDLPVSQPSIPKSLTTK